MRTFIYYSLISQAYNEANEEKDKMSAYILGDDNFDAILTACRLHFRARHMFINDEAFDFDHVLHLNKIGNILKNQNCKSVNARYNESEVADPYKFRGVTKLYNPVQLLKILDCYDYQACETNDYGQTAAYKIVKYIRKNLIKILPGYNDAKWGI